MAGESPHVTTGALGALDGRGAGLGAPNLLDHGAAGG